jgi:trans-2,3-dihydro-3-hydroxyanthranilate isomerase
MDYDITWVEVFAERALGGNLLPVITGADGVDDGVLAAVARRFQQSETSFVQRPTDELVDYRHRIFLVTGEIPFAGHPSLGTAAVVAHRAGRSSVRYVQQTIAGHQPLEVELDGRVGRVSMTQDPAEFGDTPDVGEVAAALGIAPAALRRRLRPQIVSTGLPTLIVPLTSVEAVSAAAVDRDGLGRALAAISGDAPTDHRAQTVYVVAETAHGRWRARSFVPSTASGEDAATGAAAGPFGAYVGRYLDVASITIDQGVEMGSPSRLDVDTTDGIRVSGGVRIVGSGHHELPSTVRSEVDPTT